MTSYQVYRDGGFSPICSGLAQPCTDSGLPGGVTHTYTVRARNIVGEGPGTSASAITWNVPAAPGYFTATGGVGRITLSWSAPANNGSAITRYDIYRDGGLYSTSPSPGYTDSGPGPGEFHSYFVKAVNAVGPSAASNTDSATTADYPGAPGGLTATTTLVGKIDLDWTAAAPNGSAVTQYDIFRDGVPYDSTTSTSYVDSGLGLLESHDYYVRAHNAVGAGPPSTTETGTSL